MMRRLLAFVLVALSLGPAAFGQTNNGSRQVGVPVSSLPATCTPGGRTGPYVVFLTTGTVGLYQCTDTDTWAQVSGGGGGGGAPTDATYITKTANGTLSAEQALSSLSSGIMRVATTTGTITSLGDVLPAANGGAGTVNGLLKANGSGTVSAAASGTDYAPATSGTSILYGNGSGGFSAVTVGSGLSFSTGTLSATGGGGTPAGSNGDWQINSSGSFGALTPAAGLATFVGAPSSANLAAALTDKTGFSSGAVSVFSISPTFGTSITVGAGKIQDYGSGQLGIGGTGADSYYASLAGFQATGARYFGFGAALGTVDVTVYRKAADAHEWRRGTNAQTAYWANTWTDASNNEYGRAMWSGNVWHIGTVKAGTGTARVMSLDFGDGSTSAISIPAASGDVVFGNAITVVGTVRATASSGTDLKFLGSGTIGATQGNVPSNTYASMGFSVGNAGATGFAAASNGVFGFSSSSTNSQSTLDTAFTRSAANVAAVTNGATGGAALQYTEMTAPAAGATNTVRIYAEDNGSGKTRLMAIFPTGAAQQIAIEP